ncbi:unnamed protein product [Fusarium graminearum]|uniref:Uncharacterized protein n=2 Tax=Gibberella zeae TaxID=5518 RepID=A0A4E9D6P5_GIBZA|nr:unnamed protein product [Fusarium graminearum]
MPSHDSYQSLAQVQACQRGRSVLNE